MGTNFWTNELLISVTYNSLNSATFRIKIQFQIKVSYSWNITCTRQKEWHNNLYWGKKIQLCDSYINFNAEITFIYYYLSGLKDIQIHGPRSISYILFWSFFTLDLSTIVLTQDDFTNKKKIYFYRKIILKNLNVQCKLILSDLYWLIKWFFINTPVQWIFWWFFLDIAIIERVFLWVCYVSVSRISFFSGIDGILIYVIAWNSVFEIRKCDGYTMNDT